MVGIITKTVIVGGYTSYYNKKNDISSIADCRWRTYNSLELGGTE